EGRMQPAGHAVIAAAKANGNWERSYSGGKGAELPQDFLDAVTADPQAAEALKTLDSRIRYAIYYRTTTAKRPETRAKRIADFVAKMAKGDQIL
ncbi:MAG: YdeI/OmpD-associated family protein, partial [Pseudorhodobacter sp.]|nr:YdeI/OmpD-associated family protein [Pseudorhodobacter sp.]